MMITPGTILILNGASSSGKTCLLEALQTLLVEPYLNAGIDKFIWMLPERYLDRPLWDDVLGLADQAGATGQRLFSGMHRAIAELSRSGNNVLADHVLVEPAWVRECAELFAGLPAYLIGIRCPLAVLEQRERERKDRTLGQARLQFERVHAHGVYDFEVDTSQFSIDACARRIREHIQHHSPQAFHQLRAGRASPVICIGPELGLSAICEPILRALPAWFGIERAVQQYIHDIETSPTILANVNSDVLGFLTLKVHNPHAAEIHVMGVLPEAHHQGIGRTMLERAEAYLHQQGIEYLQVKTLSASHPDAGYAKTRAFYQAMGFRPLEELPDFWDAENPCLMMIKKLAGA
jgi:chloramphenicol 3-O-phosphotransferase/ribosomal protein S18 acetylase RimI-like enzyme